MILSMTSYRERWVSLGLPAQALPDHPELGLRYPWQMIALRALSSLHRRRVATARKRLVEALGTRQKGGAAHVWRLGWSAGKDSTALAGLLADVGAQSECPAFGEKDDIDYPGEVEYLHTLGDALQMPPIEILRPEVSLLGWLAEHKIDLTEDLHSQAAGLSREHFYGLLQKHRKQSGHTAVVLGLRSNESKHRAVNRASHGWLYQRADGLTVCTPLADWEDIDVHAYLMARDLPVLPVYLCIDPGMDPLRLRKSWWLAGGGVARHGHYQWLRRWWPDLWEVAARIDPRVRVLS